MGFTYTVCVFLKR